MDFGLLDLSATERFKRNVVGRTRNPTCNIFIGGLGDVSDYTKSFDINRQVSNALRENQPSTGLIQITDVEGQWIENGHPMIKDGSSVIINAGFGNDLIPRFTGIVSNSRADTRNGEISIEIVDNAQILSEKQVNGFYSDYPFPKDLITEILSYINPNLPINYDNDSGEVATFDFGSKFSASFSSACSYGSGATMRDGAHDFSKVPLYSVIQNVMDGSQGTVTAVSATVTYCSNGLYEGTNNYWTSNSTIQDEYRVVEEYASVCIAGSGNTMTDTKSNFEKVQLGMAIQNITDGSVGLITAITSTAPATTPNDTIVCSQLHGGTNNIWANNNNYQIYERLYTQPRSYWDVIVGALYCVFQVPYFDENGVLQIQRRSKFNDTDVIFYDKDIESIDYLDAAQIINLKSVSFRKPVSYSDKAVSAEDIEVGQNTRVISLDSSIEQLKEYADFTDEPLITTWQAAGEVINQELAWFGFPRYLLTLQCMSRPELKYWDRITISSDKRKIYGRFTIIGINESFSAGNYTSRFTLLSSQERF